MFAATNPPDPRKQTKPIEDEGKSDEQYYGNPALGSNMNSISRHREYPR